MERPDIFLRKVSLFADLSEDDKKRWQGLFAAVSIASMRSYSMQMMMAMPCSSEIRGGKDIYDGSGGA